MTLSILKPDATQRNLTGKINTKFEDAGLKIVVSKINESLRSLFDESSILIIAFNLVDIYFAINLMDLLLPLATLNTPVTEVSEIKSLASVK